MYSDCLKDLPSMRGNDWRSKIHQEFDHLDRTEKSKYLMDAFCIPRSAADHWMELEGGRTLDQMLDGTTAHCVLCGEGSALRASKESGKVDGVKYPILGEYFRMTPDYAGFMTIQKFLMEMEKRGETKFAIRMNGAETSDVLAIMEMYGWNLESVGKLDSPDSNQDDEKVVMAAIVRNNAA